MRKHIREMMRYEARKDKRKPSRWVKVAFDTRQNRIYGAKKRKVNQAKGTHGRRLWNARVGMLGV